MICCKIIADYLNENASFKTLCDLLSKKGDFMWYGEAMYFADTEGDTTERKVVNCIKKAGYSRYYIEIYDKNKEPHEKEEIKGWITDKLTKILYLETEQKGQQIFRDTKEKLAELDSIILQMLEKQREDKSSDSAEEVDNGRQN